MKPEPTKEQRAYSEFIEETSAALGDDEYWCVIAPDGEVLGKTIDKRLDAPIIAFCDALECDWDDAVDAGFRLGRCRPLPSTDGRDP